jgi:hypothetical protein
VINVIFTTIYGFQIGFEVANKEALAETEDAWAVSIDLGIFRFILFKTK